MSNNALKNTKQTKEMSFDKTEKKCMYFRVNGKHVT